jgi:hypothetical protein
MPAFPAYHSRSMIVAKNGRRSVADRRHSFIASPGVLLMLQISESEGIPARRHSLKVSPLDRDGNTMVYELLSMCAPALPHPGSSQPKWTDRRFRTAFPIS